MSTFLIFCWSVRIVILKIQCILLFVSTAHAFCILERSLTRYTIYWKDWYIFVLERQKFGVIWIAGKYLVNLLASQGSCMSHSLHEDHTRSLHQKHFMNRKLVWRYIMNTPREYKRNQSDWLRFEAGGSISLFQHSTLASKYGQWLP